MNYFDLYSSYPDSTIAAAWDSQVKEADKNPWLSEALKQYGDELFARFAACYADLRALPRGARRSLQRRIARSGKLAAILPEYFQQGGRRLQHKMAWSLAGAALLLALGRGVGAAATITVTTSNPNIAADGQCSLIEAIVNANNDAATHADCAAGSGADTIVLPANANIILNAVHGFTDTFLPGPGTPIGLPEISSRITIEGNGSTIARQAGAPDFGLIAVSSRVTIEGKGLGDLTLQSVTLSGGSRFGGVQNREALITIKNSTISGNTGAGVFNDSGTLTVVNSTISGNTRYGLLNDFGRITLQNSTISGNTGGGIFNYGSGFYYGAVLTLTNSVVTGNQGIEIENVGSRYVYADHFNLFGANGNAGVSGFTPGPTDIVPSVSVAQILGPLKNNGGPTQTHALVAGSPAIDAGNPSGCRDNAGTLLPIDQRGFARLADGNNDGTVRCDIGAYEANAVIDNNATFVLQQYIDFFDREPHAGEVSPWVSALDSGLSRADLIEVFMDSGEFRFEGKFITQTYLGILTRDADYAGFRGWLGALLVGLSREQIVQVFLDSGEFQSRFGSNLTNGQFVERMYNNILLRSSDPGGFNAWVAALNNGQLTKAQMALRFLDSGEFQGLFVSQNRVDISLLYFDMLQRDPDAGGFSYWVEVLSSGVPLTAVIDGFLNSPEYRAGF